MMIITTYLKHEKTIILKVGAISISITLLLVGIFPRSTIQYSAYGINSSPNTTIIHQIAQQISSGTDNYRVDQIEQVLQKMYMQLRNAADSQKVNEIFAEIKRTVALDSHTGPLSQGIKKIAENLVSNGAKVDQTITNIVINIKKGPPPPNYINFAVGRYTAMLIYQPFQLIIQGAATIKKGNEPNSETPQVDAVLSCLYNRHIGNNLSPRFISYQDDSSSNRGANYSNNNRCIKLGITNVEEIYYNNNNFVIPVIQSNAIPQQMIELTIEHLLLEIANMAGDPVARTAINEILDEVAIHPSGSVSHSIYQISQLEMNSVDVAYKIVTAISKSVASGGNVIQVIPIIVKSALHPDNKDNKTTTLPPCTQDKDEGLCTPTTKTPTQTPTTKTPTQTPIKTPLLTPFSGYGGTQPLPFMGLAQTPTLGTPTNPPPTTPPTNQPPTLPQTTPPTNQPFIASAPTPTEGLPPGTPTEGLPPGNQLVAPPEGVPPPSTEGPPPGTTGGENPPGGEEKGSKGDGGSGGGISDGGGGKSDGGGGKSDSGGKSKSDEIG